MAWQKQTQLIEDFQFGKTKSAFPFVCTPIGWNAEDLLPGREVCALANPILSGHARMSWTKVRKLGGTSDPLDQFTTHQQFVFVAPNGCVQTACIWVNPSSGNPWIIPSQCEEPLFLTF